MTPFGWIAIVLIVGAIIIFYNQRKPPDGDGVYSEGVEYGL